MTGWKEAADNGEWNSISWELLPEQDQLELFKTLSRAIPKYERVDGYERVIRHDTPLEAKWRAEQELATIEYTGRERQRIIDNKVAAALMLVNLEALFVEQIDWLAQVEQFSQEILDASEAESNKIDNASSEDTLPSSSPAEPVDPNDNSETAPELTAEAHARRAQKHVSDYKWLIALARNEAASDEDAVWLIQMITDAAATGYWAGRRIQAATGKRIEHEALSLKPKAEKYERSASATRKTREKTHAKMADKFERSMNEMHRLVLDGHSDSSAAGIVTKANLNPTTGKPEHGFSMANLRKRYRAQKS